jgi:hypothetical protein
MICLCPNEVEERFARLRIPNRFAAPEKQRLEATPIVDRGENIFGFPVPEDQKGLNILNLRKILGTDASKQPSFFDHPWYLDEPFAHEDCKPGWHFLHMQVLPESIGQPANYANSWPLHAELPAATEVALMLFLHYVATGEQLLQKKHTWCRDRATLGRQVTVGAFGRNGLFVSAHPPEYSSRGLGICGRLTT